MFSDVSVILSTGGLPPHTMKNALKTKIDIIIPSFIFVLCVIEKLMEIIWSGHSAFVSILNLTKFNSRGGSRISDRRGSNLILKENGSNNGKCIVILTACQLPVAVNN